MNFVIYVFIVAGHSFKNILSKPTLSPKKGNTIMNPLKILPFIFLFICSTSPVHGQFGHKYLDSTELYYVNPYVGAAVAGGGFILNYLGVTRLRKSPRIETDKILALSKTAVNAFDRHALEQDPTDRSRYSKLSDRWRDAGLILPAFLFLEKRIRRQWLDVILMYAEVHAINGVTYAYMPIGPTFIERYRPVVYYDQLPLDSRNAGRNKNSFYSGHVSTTAAGSFFAAKVFSDLHPEWGAKRIFLFAAAAVPPLLVGLYRVKSLNHFTSDTIVGFAVGAFTGIFIPHLHRNRQRKLSMALNYTDDTLLFSSSLKF